MKNELFIRTISPTFNLGVFTTRSIGLLVMLGCHEKIDFTMARYGLLINGAAMCRAVKSLASRGLAKSEKSKTDRRKRFISITKDGRDLLNKMGIEQ